MGLFLLLLPTAAALSSFDQGCFQANLVKLQYRDTDMLYVTIVEIDQTLHVALLVF